MTTVRGKSASIALAVLVLGACTATSALSEDACADEWNASAGPSQLADILDATPDEASVYYVSAQQNESGSADCVLVAVTDTAGFLGVLNEDRDVQVSSIPLPEGREILKLGDPVSVSSEGLTSAP